MIDLCLITTPIPELEDDRLEPPLGYLYIASYIKKADNANVKIIDLCSVDQSEWDIPEAKYYGFSTYSTTYKRTLEIKNEIKRKYPKSRFIAGGAHATALPSDVSEDFDYVVIGEGEFLAHEIINGWLEPGIYLGGQLHDLDRIPYPDYEMIDIGSYHRVVDGKHSFSILTSRGCPNKCAFCNSVVMGGRQSVRFRSPENVYQEIYELSNKYGDIGVRFQDDMFGIQIEWLRKFTKLIKPLDIRYRAFVRANQCCNKEFTDLLYEGGCRHIALGIESGSDTILKNMQKGQTVCQCRIGLKNAKESGLIRRIYLIVGFPGETWETIKETIEFVDEAKPDEFVVYPLIPYPGTPLWEEPDKFGLRNIDRDFSKYFQICGDRKSWFVYDLDNADRVELQKMKDCVVSELEKNQAIWAKDSGNYK